MRLILCFYYKCDRAVPALQAVRVTPRSKRDCTFVFERSYIPESREMQEVH